MNWQNINLENAYELDQNIFDGLSLKNLMMLIDANLQVINEDTVKALLMEQIQSATLSALDIFEDNKEQIINKAVIDRDPEAAAAAEHNDKQTPFLDMDNSTRYKDAMQALKKGHLVEISEKSFYHFLEVLPPVWQSGKGFVMGEAYSHDNEGKGVYLCCSGSGSGQFVAQYGTIQDFRTGKLFKGEIFKDAVFCEI